MLEDATTPDGSRHGWSLRSWCRSNPAAAAVMLCQVGILLAFTMATHLCVSTIVRQCDQIASIEARVKELEGPNKNVGTTATVEMPETNPAVLSKLVANHIRAGMAQAAVLSILQEAARGTSCESMMDATVAMGKLNSVRYDLTVTQGKRKLLLNFNKSDRSSLK